MQPVVMISSFPPRLCGIGTFAEEAREFIEGALPTGRPVHVIAHLDGEGQNVHPIIDISQPDWYETVARKVAELDPYAIHIEHEYGLYNYVNEQGVSAGFAIVTGVPDPDVFRDPLTRVRTFMQRDFLWSLGKAQRRSP